MKSLNHFFLSLAVLSLFFITSCSDVTSEFWIEKSGGGRMEVSVDMAAFFPHELMEQFGGGSEMGDSLGLDSVVPRGEKESKDEIDRLFALMLEDGVVKDIDTTISLHSLKSSDDGTNTIAEIDEDIYKRAKLHLKGDSYAGTAVAKFSMDFKNENEMQEMFAGIHSMFKTVDGEVSEEEKKASIAQFKSNYKRGIIQLPTLKVPEDMGDNMPSDMPEGLDGLSEMLGGGGDLSEEDKAQMDFMKNMMGRFVVKVHAPGPIQFTNDVNAEINGNTVVFKKSILEFGQGSDQGRIIKFGK